MKENVIYWFLAISACCVLGGAAVWMGGLNQDEGWYLYAANLVSEGRIPYRDFFYTQGPLLPLVYSPFVAIWQYAGILGARLFTFALGLGGIAFAMALAARLVPPGRKGMAALAVLLLLGCNLYHLYYVAIPKTYALAALFVLTGFFLVTFRRAGAFVGAGLALGLAAGTRISLGAILPVVGLGLLLSRRWKELAGFCVGGFSALALVYAPFLADASARAGLIAAQQYHAARGGFDIVWTVGSFSRLVRWYLPAFVVFGLACGVRRFRVADGTGILLTAFAAVFAVQMLAPFPYEDYQVPVMALFTVFAVVNYLSSAEISAGHSLLLVLGLSFATSFGSPLLEKWSTNGQDRFWSLKKSTTELSQLRSVAREIEELDPKGTKLFTQDLYLAIETNRRVPKGLEMGPFAMLTDADWRKLISTARREYPIAALSGYTFAIEPPRCNERAIGEQLDYWELLKKDYSFVSREENFGQNATALLILKRK